MGSCHTPTESLYSCRRLLYGCPPPSAPVIVRHTPRPPASTPRPVSVLSPSEVHSPLLGVDRGSEGSAGAGPGCPFRVAPLVRPGTGGRRGRRVAGHLNGSSAHDPLWRRRGLRTMGGELGQPLACPVGATFAPARPGREVQIGTATAEATVASGHRPGLSRAPTIIEDPECHRPRRTTRNSPRHGTPRWPRRKVASGVLLGMRFVRRCG